MDLPDQMNMIAHGVKHLASIGDHDHFQLLEEIFNVIFL